MIKQKYQALLADWNAQNQLYQPSFFWSEASLELIEEFDKKGIENFRSLASSLSFFVPTYGVPGGGFTTEIIERLRQSLIGQVTSKQNDTINHFFSGHANALADYRVFLAANQKESFPKFYTFSESQEGNPIEQFEFDGHHYSRSALNYLLGLSYLKNFSDFSDIKTVLEIGGGFGTLGEIILKTLPGAQYIDVDIPPTSFAAEYYLQQVFGKNKVSNYNDTKDLNEIKINELNTASVLNSWQIEQLSGQIDLFVNFISFQEMEPEIVENYLQKVKALNAKWLLLRNMREGKQLRKDNRFGVDKPIFSKDYIKMLGGYELIGTNVYPFGYKTIDEFHSEIMLFKRFD